MASDRSGIIQTPMDPVVPTPDSSGGWSGTPGGFDQGEKGNGLTAIPWSDKPVPTLSGEETSSSDFGKTIRQTPIGNEGTFENAHPTEGDDIKKGVPSPNIARR